MLLSSDVNIIFAYVNDDDLFHIPVCLYLIKQKRKTEYVLLDEVKTSFLHTLSDYLSTSCLLIEKAIMDFKERRKKTKREPSPFLINTLIRDTVKKELVKLSSNKNFNLNAVNAYLKKMQSEYSIISLYEESEKLAEFREKYLQCAQKEALTELNKFLRKYKSFEVVNFNDLTTTQERMKEIKDLKIPVFKNKQDYEDMKIASQYLAFNKEKQKLAFMTADKEFFRSLKEMKKIPKFVIGEITLVMKYEQAKPYLKVQK